MATNTQAKPKVPQKSKPAPQSIPQDPRQDTPQPRFWGMGFCCPYHGDRPVGLTNTCAGEFECAVCERVFVQRTDSMLFDAYERGEERVG